MFGLSSLQMVRRLGCNPIGCNPNWIELSMRVTPHHLPKKSPPTNFFELLF